MALSSTWEHNHVFGTRSCRSWGHVRTTTALVCTLQVNTREDACTLGLAWLQVTYYAGVDTLITGSVPYNINSATLAELFFSLFAIVGGGFLCARRPPSVRHLPLCAQAAISLALGPQAGPPGGAVI